MATTGKIRIIGGEWRGRTLRVHHQDGLRPTADRVRETLFNWLGPRIVGARCLDMFAGSGALGLEALSRGAHCCHFIEQAPKAAQVLNSHIEMLGAQSAATVLQRDAMSFQSCEPYDTVFVDPPFDAELATAALQHILAERLVAKDGRIYLEFSKSQPCPSGDPRLTLLRDKTAGDVRYQLLGLA